MILKTSRLTSGAIEARMIDLLNRRAALDQAIASLERYSTYAAQPSSAARPESGEVIQMKPAARLAGAA